MDRGAALHVEDAVGALNVNRRRVLHGAVGDEVGERGVSGKGCAAAVDVDEEALVAGEVAGGKGIAALSRIRVAALVGVNTSVRDGSAGVC